MNKQAIQKFAASVRRELIDQITNRAHCYGITETDKIERTADVINGRPLSEGEKRMRVRLIERLDRVPFSQVIEEAAYTWFNRFVAIRFMEVNDFLPSRIRVLSSEDDTFDPEIIRRAREVDLPGLDLNSIDTADEEELYRALLMAQCNALNSILPKLFEPMDGCMELLLPANILSKRSNVARLVTEIPADDWRDQVQIVGWMYQYYNSELKDETFSLLKTKNIKISKERITSATQLFTPDWIVLYMVQNSLGRLWMRRAPSAALIKIGSTTSRTPISRRRSRPSSPRYERLAPT